MELIRLEMRATCHQEERSLQIQPVEIVAHVQLLDFNASREVRAHANVRCQLKNDYFEK